MEIWSIDLNPPGAFIQTALASLPAEEQSRAAQFKTGLLRQRFIVAHAALRQLLAARLRIAPAELTLCNGPHGKPELAGTLVGKLFLNLSHSGDLALVAISPDAEVGIDVEHVRPQPDAHRIAKRFFTANEAAALSQLPEVDQTAGFFHVWTRKEALVKATGEGIAHALARFEVSCDAEARLLTVDGDPAGAARWTLHGFNPADDYIAAVAVQKADAQFSFHQYQCEPT